MTALVQWHPTREMATLRRNMDRIFHEAFGPSLLDKYNGGTTAIALNVAEEEDAYIITASVPGIAPDALEVSFNDGLLTVKGEVIDESESKEANYHLRERHFGQYSRSIRLPATIDADAIEAVHENGVLTLTLPKAEDARPKRIEVKGK
ncbi:Hsp20/alpha crystallin family protein [Chloroflexi bacterium TSY]|nr:Hsp20/alpha crystallin family protein [Chloroflexi bacterium TSY]